MSATVTQELRLRSAGRQRFVELDGLRGLAAFIVLWNHLWYAFHDDGPAWYLRPLFAGRASVVLFFVLSGYVLSLPVWNKNQSPYGTYLVRRFFRIYVPFAAAALLAVTGAHFFLNAQEPLSSWFYQTWHTPLTWTLLFQQLLTIPPGGALNVAFWSLRYEVVMSMVMPFVARFVRKMPVRILLTVTLAAIFMTPSIELHAHNNHATALLKSVYWAVSFVLGSLLSLYRSAIAQQYSLSSFGRKMFALALTVCGYYSNRDPFVVVASCAVIVFALNSRAHRWLRTVVPEYLGRVSYSMYLIHGTVLWIVLIVLLKRVAIWELALIYLALVIIASHLFCLLVEEPSLRFGKRIASSRRPLTELETRSNTR